MSDSLDIVRTFTTIENNYITVEQTLLCYNEYLENGLSRFCIYIDFSKNLSLFNVYEHFAFPLLILHSEDNGINYTYYDWLDPLSFDHEFHYGGGYLELCFKKSIMSPSILYDYIIIKLIYRLKVLKIRPTKPLTEFTITVSSNDWGADQHDHYSFSENYYIKQYILTATGHSMNIYAPNKKVLSLPEDKSSIGFIKDFDALVTFITMDGDYAKYSSSLDTATRRIKWNFNNFGAYLIKIKPTAGISFPTDTADLKNIKVYKSYNYPYDLANSKGIKGVKSYIENNNLMIKIPFIGTMDTDETIKTPVKTNMESMHIFIFIPYSVDNYYLAPFQIKGSIEFIDKELNYTVIPEYNFCFCINVKNP